MRRIAPLRYASALLGFALILSAPAEAQVGPFAGPWAVSGQIVIGALVTSVVPLCQFQQAGPQLSGTCEGPNALGPASGMVNGPNISWQWRVMPKNPIALNGVATFHGTLGPDNVIRGGWSFSQMPGSSGPFTAHRP